MFTPSLALAKAYPLRRSTLSANSSWVPSTQARRQIDETTSFMDEFFCLHIHLVWECIRIRMSIAPKTPVLCCRCKDATSPTDKQVVFTDEPRSETEVKCVLQTSWRKMQDSVIISNPAYHVQFVVGKLYSLTTTDALRVSFPRGDVGVTLKRGSLRLECPPTWSIMWPNACTYCCGCLDDTSNRR